MKKLKDGRLVADSTLKGAKSILKLYNMDLDTLIGCVFDFESAYEKAGFAEGGGNYHKYRRGYLLKCDEIYSRESI
ncbi:hypothetical protein KAR91_40935 [Candidatus Pacearchaeota archaeon]|nr:hypothetical protein [Candidatus Pacearchaeota archaeon]